MASIYSLFRGEAIQKIAEREGGAIEVKPYTWSRDPSDTKEVVQDLKKNILQAYEVAKNDGRPLAIVAHSWGSVIAYAALQELGNEVSIDKFTTMGSPLNSDDPVVKEFVNKHFIKEIPSNTPVSTPMIVLEGLGALTKPASVKEWINMWAEYDPFSGAIGIPEVKDIQVDKDAVAKAQKISKDPTVLYGTSAMVSPATRDLKKLQSIALWHEAYYKGVHGLRLESTDETINWDIPKDFLTSILPDMPSGVTQKIKTEPGEEALYKTMIKNIKETVKEKAEEFIKKQVVSTVLTEALSLPSLPVKIGVGLTWPKTALAPSPDPSRLSERTVQNIAQPTPVTFTETFAGFNSETPDFPGSKGAKLSFSSLSGNRTGVLPSALTQTMSGRFEALNGSANTLVNVPISGTITGSGIFINGQPLKTESELTMKGIIDFKSAKTKEFTINPNGTSSGSFKGNTFDPSNPNTITGTVQLDYNAKPK